MEDARRKVRYGKIWDFVVDGKGHPSDIVPDRKEVQWT
jgi:hypothetical protein